jgi:hypothetical protein
MNGQMDSEANTFAARGLEELFLQLCCCVSFLVLAGNSLWCYFCIKAHSITKRTGTSVLGTTLWWEFKSYLKNAFVTE